jgi:hypothetical protein
LKSVDFARKDSAGLGTMRSVKGTHIPAMIPLNAKVNHVQLEPSNRFSARAEVVVPDKIVFVELFDLPSGVHATNLSDVAPGTHELLLHGDGAAPFKVGDTLYARGFSRDELPD